MEETHDPGEDDGTPPRDADPAMDRVRRARLLYRLAHARTVQGRRQAQERWAREAYARVGESDAPHNGVRPSAPRRPRILVVDRAREIRDMLSAAFEADGYVVLTASDAGEALGLIAHVAPAVVLLELALPHLTNGMLVPALRERGIRAPVILLTDSPSARAWARQLGAAGYLGKPLEPAAVRAVVARALRRGPGSGFPTAQGVATPA